MPRDLSSSVRAAKEECETVRKDLSVKYYFWIISDWAYFGGWRLHEMTERYGVKVDYRPVKLAMIYDRTGGMLLPRRSRQRQDYRIAELKRWRARLGMTLNIEPRYFPVDDEPGSRVVIAAKRMGFPLAPLTNAIMKAMWAEDRNIANRATLHAIGSSVGLDMDAVMAEAATNAVLKEYSAYTEEAPDDGVFGSPFFIFRGEPFWGQDRLDFLEEAIAHAVASE
jgi:2-hydroxychromene-2-carboxylate isomerase